MNNSLLCPWESPYLLVFSSNVPQLLYYSHLPVLAAAVLLSFAIYRKSHDLTSNVLVAVLGLFSFYALMDVLIWATNRSDIVLFLWSIQVMIEVLIFAASFYLVYLVTSKSDCRIFYKWLFGAILIPFILLIPTRYNLVGIDLSYCDAIEGFAALYLSYILEVFFSVLIIGYAVHKYFLAKEGGEKKKVFILALGVILFLIALISGNVIGSFTGNWSMAQFGFFGMPIFIGLITYLVIEFKMFNLRIIGAQALVLALAGLIASQLFFVKSITNYILICITLALVAVFGLLLVRSVKKEVILVEELKEANAGQADLFHIINHQIKGYMTKARLAFDDLLHDGSYGLGEKAKPMIEEGFNSMTEGVTFVENFLNASNIERGTFTYNMAPLSFKKIIEEQAAAMKTTAEEKGLKFELKIKEGRYDTTGDQIQLSQAVRNLIDNSIKYTPKGVINLQLTTDNKKILLKIQDTGVGISNELKPKLFTKGGRDKDSQKINVNSTGFGLALVKGVVEAHKGRVWAESPGVNKGSTFYMELPSKIA